jgi:hypothetical protein
MRELIFCSTEGNDMKKLIAVCVVLICPCGCMAPGRVYDSHLLWDMQNSHRASLVKQMILPLPEGGTSPTGAPRADMTTPVAQLGK